MPPPNTFGFDACDDCSRFIGGLPAAGDKFIMRYVGKPSWKTMTEAEAVLCAIVGIAVAPIWETTAQASLGGAGVGRTGGQTMLGPMAAVGLLPGTGVIAYPTSDFDSTAGEYTAVSAYYRAFGEAIAPGYKIGAYANGYTTGRMFADGIIASRWVTQSGGFTGTKEALAAGAFEIAQRLPANVTINGATINVDPDSLLTPTEDIGARVPWGGAVPQGASLNAGSIQALLNKAGQQPPLGVDDVTGNATNSALKSWLAKSGHASLEWGGAIEALLQQAGVPIWTAAAV